MRILVVEDDHRVARGLVTALTREGYEVTRVATAADALAAAPADIVLLDLTLPDGDGIDLCRRLRRTEATGVIMVTARAEEYHRVRGLRSGADDYVVKPFSVPELMARIDALARRTRGQRAVVDDPGHVDVGALRIELGSRTVTTADGSSIDLTRKEFDLLALLAAHDGRVVSRSKILDQVWGVGYETASRTLDVHVAALRGKLPPECGARISTVRGIGYRLVLE